MSVRALLLVHAPEAVYQAFRQLATYRLRTGLALSGIAVGIAAVVGSTTLTDAVARNLRGTYERIGGLRVGWVNAISGVYRDGRWVPFPKEYPITNEDRQFLVASLPEVERQCATRWGEGRVSTGRVSLRTVTVLSCGPDYPLVRPFQLRDGRFFTAGEDERSERVAVVFDVLAEDLFGRTDVLGEEVLVAGQRFRIVGVLKRWWFGERNAYRRLFIPFQTGVSRLGRNPNGANTWLKLRPGATWATATPAILRLLVLRHPGSKAENFRVRTVGDFQDRDLAPLAAQGDILAAVALICLFTGGIGILNVFLVSVAQRTAEIGLRMALGASRASILGQILFEALVLCTLGGAVGLAAGQGVALGFAAITRKSMTTWDLFDRESFSVSLGGKGILLALALTLLTTVLAGVWPAWCASRLDPAEAMRHEG